MIVIVGGVASGKRTFARSLGFADEDMADAVLDDRPAIFNLQRLVAERPEPGRAAELAESLAGKACVICDEVGSGIVPVERAERVAREQTGRLVNLLAAEATLVVRMACGIPVVLKGELPEGLAPGGRA